MFRGLGCERWHRAAWKVSREVDGKSDHSEVEQTESNLRNETVLHEFYVVDPGTGNTGV